MFWNWNFEINPYVRASQTHYFLTLKTKLPYCFHNANRETKQKLGKHTLLQTKRQSHGWLTFPPAGVRREDNVRVPKVLAAGALGKKHLEILFCRKWNKRPRNSSCVPHDGWKQWHWSCNVLVESVFSWSFLFFMRLASLFLLLFFFSSTVNLSNLTVTLLDNERNFLYSMRFSPVFGCFFSALFSPFFSSSFSFFPAPIRSLEGLIYSLNMSLFRKDSMH